MNLPITHHPTINTEPTQFVPPTSLRGGAAMLRPREAIAEPTSTTAMPVRPLSDLQITEPSQDRRHDPSRTPDRRHDTPMRQQINQILAVMCEAAPMHTRAALTGPEGAMFRSYLEQLCVNTASRMPNAQAYAIRTASEQLAISHPVHVLLDLDGLKIVNDTLGYEAGNQLLRAVAEATDTVLANAPALAIEGFHIGGDEFKYRAASQCDADRFLAALTSVLSSYRIPVEFDGQRAHLAGVKFSAGIGLTADLAEDAMHADKHVREITGERLARGDLRGITNWLRNAS